MQLTTAPRVHRTRRSTSNGLLDSQQNLRAILDAIESNVFVADLDLRLIYMNRKAERTAADLDGDLRDAFRVGSDEVLGGSIHRFHRDPARVEAILRNPANFPHHAVFSFGEVTLRTEISAVVDADDGVIGYVVAWEDVSEKRRLEEGAVHLADDVAAAADQLNSVSAALGENATETSAQATTVAAATEEMSVSLRDVAQGASIAAQAASDAAGAATKATTLVEQLAESAARVGEIVGLINSIADQTNLLALNATIEAARAGDHGRGFAVVASEVKDLSRETAAATKQIADIVGQLQEECAVATSELIAVQTMVTNIDEQQASIASAVEQQHAVTNEIAMNVSYVADAADGTTRTIVELSSAAQSLAVKAQELHAVVTTED